MGALICFLRKGVNVGVEYHASLFMLNQQFFPLQVQDAKNALHLIHHTTLSLFSSSPSVQPRALFLYPPILSLGRSYDVMLSCSKPATR